MKTAAVILLLAASASSQTPRAFEVASVKPTAHGRDANGWSYSSVDVPTSGRLVARTARASWAVFREKYVRALPK